MRGQLALDILVMCLVMFGLAIVFIYISKLNTDVTTPLIAANSTGTQGTQMLTQQRDGFAPLWDNLGIFIFGLVWVFLLISSYYINTSPIFFIVMVILMIGSFIVIMILANAFDSLSQDQNFAAGAATFPKVTWLMYHLLEAAIVVVITCGIALYAKKDTGGVF
jgi:hypothetical protein